MRDLMLHHHVVEVSMESTSVYWIPIWRVLSPHFKLNLANPYFIKQLPGRKSDVKDAQWIAECTMKELIRSSFVPPEIIQQLRQYDRRIFDLNEEIVRKLSKLDAVLQRCNIRLSNYISNVDRNSYIWTMLIYISDFSYVQYLLRFNASKTLSALEYFYKILQI